MCQGQHIPITCETVCCSLLEKIIEFYFQSFSLTPKLLLPNWQLKAMQQLNCWVVNWQMLWVQNGSQLLVSVAGLQLLPSPPWLLPMVQHLYLRPGWLWDQEKVGWVGKMTEKNCRKVPSLWENTKWIAQSSQDEFQQFAQGCTYFWISFGPTNQSEDLTRIVPRISKWLGSELQTPYTIDPKPTRNNPSTWQTWYCFIPLWRCGFPCSALGHCVLGAKKSVFWMDSTSTEHRDGHTPLVIQGIFLNVFQDVHIIANCENTTWIFSK